MGVSTVAVTPRDLTPLPDLTGDSARPRIPLSEYTRHQRRSTTPASTDPAEAGRPARSPSTRWT